MADIVTKLEKCLLAIAAAALLLLVISAFRPVEALTIVPVYERAPAVSESADALWLDITQSVDLNHATARELEALPGIGETLAKRIVAYRSIHGPFETVEELLKVEGIHESTLRDILARTSLRESK